MANVQGPKLTLSEFFTVFNGDDLFNSIKVNEQFVQ